MTVHASLDEQVPAALRQPASAIDVAAILALAETERTTLDRSLRKARQDALSPLASREEAEASRSKACDTEFERDRLEMAIAALRDRVAELSAAEAADAATIERQAAAVERDALAATIAERYPAIVKELTGLAKAIAASDARIAKAGAGESAECVARGYQANGYWSQGAGAVERIGGIRLPLFSRHGVAFGDSRPGCAWPGLED